MGEVVALNGGQRPPQVYGCGVCEDQGHRLLLDNEIVCGHPECGAPSAFMHYEPEKLRAGESIEDMKTKEARADRKVNYLCPRCRGNRFHLHPSGTLTCFRCRHSVPFKWWNPQEA